MLSPFIIWTTFLAISHATVNRFFQPGKWLIKDAFNLCVTSWHTHTIFPVGRSFTFPILCLRNTSLDHNLASAWTTTIQMRASGHSFYGLPTFLHRCARPCFRRLKRQTNWTSGPSSRAIFQRSLRRTLLQNRKAFCFAACFTPFAGTFLLKRWPTAG